MARAQLMALLLALPPCMAMRQKFSAKVALADAGRSFSSASAGAPMDADEVTNAAKDGADKIGKVTCDGLEEGMVQTLSDIKEALDVVCQVPTPWLSPAEAPAPVPYTGSQFELTIEDKICSPAVSSCGEDGNSPCRNFRCSGCSSGAFCRSADEALRCCHHDSTCTAVYGSGADWWTFHAGCSQVDDQADEVYQLWKKKIRVYHRRRQSNDFIPRRRAQWWPEPRRRSNWGDFRRRYDWSAPRRRHQFPAPAPFPPHHWPSPSPFPPHHWPSPSPFPPHHWPAPSPFPPHHWPGPSPFPSFPRPSPFPSFPRPAPFPSFPRPAPFPRPSPWLQELRAKEGEVGMQESDAPRALAASSAPTPAPGRACPAGSRRVPDPNAYISGCGLQQCQERYGLADIVNCQQRCEESEQCIAYTWSQQSENTQHANETVCTLHDTDTPDAPDGAAGDQYVTICRLDDKPQPWVLGVGGVSCAQACAWTGRKCNADAMHNVIDEASVRAKMRAAGFVCESVGDEASDGSWFSERRCGFNRNGTAPSCDTWELGAASWPLCNCVQAHPEDVCPRGEMQEGSEECRYKCNAGLPKATISRVRDLSTSLATAIMTSDKKRCMREVMAHEDVAEALAEVNAYVANLTSGPDADTNERVQLGFSRLASWQDQLVSMGSTMVDRDVLYPSDVENIFDCPQPCRACSKKHNSLFKAEEKFKFKCYLAGAHRHLPPHLVEGRIQCEAPKRRMWKFWEFKTWCTVPGWIADVYQDARIAAMVKCGSRSLLTTLQSGQTMPEDVLRTCMLAEQRMAVTMRELRDYRDFLAAEGDDVVPTGMKHIFSFYIATSTAQGLVGLRDAAGPPPSDDDWEQLLRGGNYTLLPPALVASVPCEPPVDNKDIFLGAFSAIISVGSGAMLGLVSVMPQVLLLGFFFVLAGFLIGPALSAVVTFRIISASKVPQLFMDTFTRVATHVHNAIMPSNQVKTCPRGILMLGSAAPLCIDDMDTLEAKRYTCPEDQSRSIVLSCEPEFNGVVALRGEPCGTP